MFPGVRVSKGQEDYDLPAPCIISAAGAINTFKKLLPKEIAAKSSECLICVHLLVAYEMLS